MLEQFYYEIIWVKGMKAFTELDETQRNRLEKSVSYSAWQINREKVKFLS